MPFVVAWDCRSLIHSLMFHFSLSLSLIFIGGQVGKQIGWLVMQARANITFAFRQCTNTLFMISILYVLYVSSIVFLFLCYLFQVVSILGLSRNLFLCSLCFSMLFTFFFCLTFLPILYITLSLLLEVTYLLIALSLSFFLSFFLSRKLILFSLSLSLLHHTLEFIRKCKFTPFKVKYRYTFLR